MYCIPPGYSPANIPTYGCMRWMERGTDYMNTGGHHRPTSGGQNPEEALLDEYDHVHNCRYNQPDFSLEDVKRIIRNICTDSLAHIPFRENQL